MNKDKKLLFGIGIVFLFLTTVSFTYAYFTATIVNKDVKDQVVQTGTLELTYTDGPEINIQNMKPGNTIAKTITVKNTGSLETKYNIIWQELTNEITNDEMLIEGTCTSSSGTCESIESSSISDKSIKKNISIASGVTHTYNLTITFKDTNTSQNYNQGKKFNGVLGIEEYKKESIYCTFDGELTQGSEYINGVYTYRYKQSYKTEIGPVAGDGWFNIDTDGWGITLTNKRDTSPVNDKICTSINGKPLVSMAGMFIESRASNIDLNGADTSNVIDMNAMFKSCSSSSINLNNINTSNVTNMAFMFWNTSIESLDLSSFDTSNVTSMGYMFYKCANLKTIYASDKFVTTNVTDKDSMFTDSTKLVGGAGTVYDANHVDKEYARVDGGTALPGYFTLKQ